MMSEKSSVSHFTRQSFLFYKCQDISLGFFSTHHAAYEIKMVVTVEVMNDMKNMAIVFLLIKPRAVCIQLKFYSHLAVSATISITFLILT